MSLYLDRIGDLKLFEGIEGNDPGADGRGKVLGEKRAKRDILPLLDVAGCATRIGPIKLQLDKSQGLRIFLCGK
jgi:hypothetical protein